MPTTDPSRDALIAFYRQALTVTADTTPDVVLGRILADSFASRNGQGTKDKATLIAQVRGFWKLIPNLKWEPQELLPSGDKFVVRSVASGNPVGSFMGLTLDGSTSFRIDTIDIHSIENGQITQVYHLEDWATAMGQLKSA